MAKIGNFAAEQIADYIDYTSKVIEASKECGSDTFLVVKLSARKSALVTGQGVNLVPPHETILARKDYASDPEYFV